MLHLFEGDEHPRHGTHLGLEPTPTPKARAEMALLSVVHGQTRGSFNPSLSPGLSAPLCTHLWSSWLRGGLVGRTPQGHVLRLGVRVLEACQSNRPFVGLRPGPRGKLRSISVATGLVLVLAWEPAHCTLPSPAGVVSSEVTMAMPLFPRLSPASLPAFLFSRAWESSFSVPARLQHPLTVGPPVSQGQTLAWG